jgi:hypothetical protein
MAAVNVIAVIAFLPARARNGIVRFTGSPMREMAIAVAYATAYR